MGKGRKIDFRLYLISDRTRCGGRTPADALSQACMAGVRAVQLREKDLSPIDYTTLAMDIQSRLADSKPTFLINDRADIAHGLHADGVHLPESGIPPQMARACLGPDAIIGCSTHSLDRAVEMAECGADFLTFSPIFDTPSKSSYGAPQGLQALAKVTQSVNIPVFALGGITPDRVSACMDAGAAGVAAISAILSAPDISQAVHAFQDRLGRL